MSGTAYSEIHEQVSIVTGDGSERICVSNNP